MVILGINQRDIFFSSWCDEYYNLRILLIGEYYLQKCRSKVISGTAAKAAEKKNPHVQGIM